MSEFYFNKFPIISYANTVVRNISERTKILHNRLLNPDLFFPFELQEHMRADLLANRLYNDSFMDWVLYLNNNVYDPYYDWHLSDREFHSTIRDKYGSIPVAIQKIAYFRTAWPDSDNSDRLSVDTYKYTIPKSWQKYYQPKMDDYGAIQYYYKSFLDWRMHTNQMLQWNVSMTTPNTVFAQGNLVQVISGGNVVGQAQVITANSTLVTAQHTFGNTASPNGLQDMFNTTITATISTTKYLANNISLEEGVFWEPVSFYDMEEEANAYKRFVSVIDGGTALQLSTQMNRLLRQ